MESSHQSFQYSAPTWPYTSMVSSSSPPTPTTPSASTVMQYPSSSPSPPPFSIMQAQIQSTAAGSHSLNSFNSTASTSPSNFSSPIHSYSSSPSGSSCSGSCFSPSSHQMPTQAGRSFLSSPSSSPHTPSPRPTGFGNNAGNDIRFMPSMAAHFVPPRTTPEEDISAMLTGVSLKSDAGATRQWPQQRDLPLAFMGMQLTGPAPESLVYPMASMGLGRGKPRVEDAAEMMAGLSFGNDDRVQGGHPQQMQWLPGMDPNIQIDPGYTPMDMDVDHRATRGHTHHHQSYIN